MRECKGFSCKYRDELKGCEKYGRSADCSIRKCIYSCRYCEKTCNNKKYLKNRTGNQEETAI